MVLAGYIDGRGSEGYNIELSKKRAEAVRDYLLTNFKIDKDRITLHWYGKADQIASNLTPKRRAANRRVVGILSLMKFFFIQGNFSDEEHDVLCIGAVTR